MSKSRREKPLLIKFSSYLPALDWLLNYRSQFLVGDITAGIIVTSLLIPQSMAYALLAGLPPQVGLYASILPAILYPLIGTSRVLAVGPVAVDSLMVAAAIANFSPQSTPEYLALAVTLAFLVGAIEIIMGLLRLGFLVNFLSRSVTSGFISDAAVIIGFSQVKHLLGLKIPATESFGELVTLIVRNLAQINWITLALGIASVGILVYFNRPLVKQLKQRGWNDRQILPISKSAPLVVVILGTLLVWGLHLDRVAGIKVVGSIPAGLSSLTLPLLDWQTLKSLLPAAVTVMFLTPLFYFLPQACLAAVIITAVYTLIDVATLRRMWAYDKGDAIAWLTTFGAVLALGVEQGIMLGALIALALHLWRTSHPHIAIVGRLGDSEHFRNVLRHDVKTSPKVLAVRVDASLYFANAKYLKNFLTQTIADRSEIKSVLLVCSAINLIDASALEILESLIADFRSLGIQFYFAEVKGPVMDKLTKIGFVDYVGRDRFFLSTDIAMQELAGI